MTTHAMTHASLTTLCATALRGLLLAGLWLGSATLARAAADPLYFTFQDIADFPAEPANIRIFAPSFIDVPAGAVLRVHLLRGEMLVATSTLTFPRAFQTGAAGQPIPYPAADFYPPNAANTSGFSLGESEINGGKGDLLPVVQTPAQYRFLWHLSAGVMGTPSRTVITAARGVPTVKFTDLKLCATSAAASLDDQKPGSLLFFNRYTSSPSNAAREDTQLSLTNTNPGANTFVRLFFVNSATCEVSSFTLCLAARQTIGFALSDLDPGVRGYIMAVATDVAGRPADFNWLIGQVVLKQPLGGRSVSSLLKAYTVAKRKDGVVAADGSNQAELIFDNVNYDRLPAQLAFDGVPTQLNGLNTTQFSFFRPLANFAGGGAASATVQVTGFGADAQNQVVATSGTVPLSCVAETSVGSLRLTPVTVNNLIQPGAFAWFTASTNDLLPLLGTQITGGETSSGTAARALSFSAEYRIKIPVSAAVCSQ